MRLSAVATLTVLSMPFLVLEEARGQLVGGKQAAREHPPASPRGKKTTASFHGGDAARGMRRQPSAGLQKTEEGDGGQDGSPSKGVSWAQPGVVNKLAAGSKESSPQLPPPERTSQGLQKHLRGHGKFNADTYSCFGIQSKTCKRPSDCDGCLGLYTCKLPRGKCDLKAVSRKTGGFSRSIRNR
ncbi:uncharacterized protein LOC143838488 [Paroedura picta]|uniref:uncharacterized protein LOC143838488 n=1 Tax=Paroedura picta TaxID=143630 RepID=UPI004055D871